MSCKQWVKKIDLLDSKIMAKPQLDPLHKPTFCLYFQGSSYKCKERCIEGHRSVTVERHVHGDQPLRKQPEHKYPSIQLSIYPSI